VFEQPIKRARVRHKAARRRDQEWLRTLELPSTSSIESPEVVCNPKTALSRAPPFRLHRNAYESR
jgi:hypothetical protein